MEIRLNWTAIFALGVPLVLLAFLLVWLFLRLARWQIPHDKNLLTAVESVRQGKQFVSSSVAGRVQTHSN